jgi:hypothetical protein
MYAISLHTNRIGWRETLKESKGSRWQGVQVGRIFLVESVVTP